MLFIITKLEGNDGIPEHGIDPIPDMFHWTLWTVEKGEPQEAVARSPKLYDSENEARSEIATAKIRLKAARFARVKGLS